MRAWPLLLAAATAHGVVSAATESCDADRAAIPAATTRPFLICGENITADTVFTGLREAGLTLRYRQYLRRCDVHDDRPGLYVHLEAGMQTGISSLRMVDAKTGETVCRPVGMEIVAKNSAADSSAAPAWRNAMSEDQAQFIDVSGIRTRYFEEGRGETLLLVHGGQPSSADASAWDWQQNFDGLARQFRVIALDRLGQGYTGNPADLDDYENYYPAVAEHLRAFLDAMKLERVHLVGHSQGGWPVTRIALDLPDRVASLVLIDSTMIAPAKNAAQAVRFYLYLQNELHPAGGDTPESTRRLMEMYSFTRANITDQRVRRIVEISRLAKFAAARAWFREHLMSPAHPSYRALKAQAWEDLQAGRLQVPTLLIWGLNDPEGSFPAGLGLFRALGEAGTPVRFHGFAQSGHAPYIESPEEFNALVAAFCEDSSGPRITSRRTP